MTNKMEGEKKVVGYSLPIALKDKIEHLAKATGFNGSAFVENVLSDFVDEAEGKQGEFKKIVRKLLNKE